MGTKTRDNEDRRITWIEITPKGRKDYLEVHKKHMKYLSNLLSVFTYEEKEALIKSLKYFKGLFKTSHVEFVKATNVYEDYYEIELKPEAGTSWVSGMHAVFTLPNKKVKGKKFRAFSIASTQKENTILLGTRTGKEVSSFKQALLSMKQGEKVKMRGPFGWFHLMNDSSPIVMIALGVGITPIRALLTEL